MWSQQVEVPHHHLTGPMGVSPHNTSYKSFASWLMNVLVLYLVVSIFFFCLKVTIIFNSKLLSTVVGLRRDLKTWCVMVLITMITTTSPNLSTNKTVYISCVCTFVVHFLPISLQTCNEGLVCFLISCVFVYLNELWNTKLWKEDKLSSDWIPNVSWP